MITRDGTGPAVRVTHGQAERPLPKPWLNEHGVPVPRRVSRSNIGIPVPAIAASAREALHQDASALAGGHVVNLSPLIPRRRPVGWGRDPLSALEEHRRGQHHTADAEVA